MIEVGRQVPDIAGTIQDGSTLALSNLRGRSVVVYFYPKDNTSGCTLEAQDFRDHYATFKHRKCEIVGVSRDSTRSHQNFRAKHQLPFPLIADTDEIWCNAFDVVHEKVLYGKRYLGIVRSTFLINADGMLRAEWRNVKVRSHVEAVLERLSAK